MNPNGIDLTNKTFTFLKVKREAGRNNWREILWECECVCGKTIIIPGYALRKGQVSCGCVRDENNRLRHLTHGLRHHPLWSIWNRMKQRCSNPKSKDFKWYGGRGITVSEEWENNFRNFFDWAIEHGYQRGLEIDRRDNNGRYESANCRWVTHKENMNNSRRKKEIKFKTLIV